jgi:peptide/nickel transport system substrate-binding protein
MRNSFWRSSLLAAALLLAACGGGAGTRTTSTATHGPVSVRLDGDWITLNPYATSTINTVVIMSGIYDRLVALSPDQKSVVPYLAKSFKVTPTPLTFDIRKGVTCSDGTPVGPTQIADSLRFMLTQVGVTQILGPGPGSAHSISSDDNAGTVTVTMAKPFSDAIYNFTNTHAAILCPAEINLIKQGVSDKAVGSGPYTISNAVHNDHMTLQPRSDWTWGPNGESAKNPGFPSQLNLMIVGNETTAANELLTGQLNVAGVSGADVTRLIDNKSFIHTTYGGSYLSELAFNDNVALVKDPKIRQAIITAINTKDFMQADTGGFGVTSPSYLAPAAACYDAATAKLHPTQSVTDSQKLFQAAGYTLDNSKLTKNGQPLTIRLLSTSARFGHGPEYLSDTLSKVGINVQLTNVDSGTYTANILAGKYDVVTTFLSGGGPAPGNYILYMTGPTNAHGGSNSGIDDPEVDPLVTAAFQATGATQCAAWAKVQEKVIGNWDALPLDQQTKQYFTTGIKMDTGTWIWLDSLHR